VFGTGLLTPDVQHMGGKLMADQVPTAWTKVWEGPEDSRKWLRAVVSKRVALSKWAERVRRTQADPLAVACSPSAPSS
jgi:hypothetical protein